MEEKEIEVTENTTASKPKKSKEEIVELLVAIFLGVAALLSAWASWIGSLHGGNQATNYTTSNNMSADGNARWNEASQSLMQDMMTWNTLSDLIVDMAFLDGKEGKEDELEQASFKYDKILKDNCSEEFQEAISWALSQEDEDGLTSPFSYVTASGETFIETYYDDARAVLAEAESILEQGKNDNSNGDKYGLAAVILSIILFLLGIIGIFKRIPNRMVILIVAVIALIATAVYMISIPLPTGFSITSYFG